MSERPLLGWTGLDLGWSRVPLLQYITDPAVSASRLWRLHNGTASKLRQELLAGPQEHSDAEKLGDLVHTAVLEPEEFESRYIVLDRCSALKKTDEKRCTNPGKFYREGKSYCGMKGHDPKAGAPMEPGIVTVGVEDKTAAWECKAALLAHPIAGRLLSSQGERERTGTCTHEETGLSLRIRPDLLLDDEGAPRGFEWSNVNIKSTAMEAVGRWPYWAEDSGLYFKAGFYRMVLREIWGAEPQHFLFPVVEVAQPHDILVYRLNDDVLDIGEAEALSALRELAICLDRDEWPGYPAEVREMAFRPSRMKAIARLRDLELLEA